MIQISGKNPKKRVKWTFIRDFYLTKHEFVGINGHKGVCPVTRGYLVSLYDLRRISNMNKNELVAAIAEKTDLKKADAEKALKAFTEVVADELKKGEKIQLVGFGTFEVVEKPAREGRNPRTGETMKIAASKAPKFKAGKALKDSLN
jgi:DNA-binding protein HU-beta